MIMIIPTMKYGSTYYKTFTMGVFYNYHGYFFQCTVCMFMFYHYIDDMYHVLKIQISWKFTQSPVIF